MSPILNKDRISNDVTDTKGVNGSWRRGGQKLMSMASGLEVLTLCMAMDNHGRILIRREA